MPHMLKDIYIKHWLVSLYLFVMTTGQGFDRHFFVFNTFAKKWFGPRLSLKIPKNGVTRKSLRVHLFVD